MDRNDGAVSIYYAKDRKAKEIPPVVKTDDGWRAVLTTNQFFITREHGTEPAFTGEYHAKKEPGIYRCVCCGTDLFFSRDKFDSGSGWPSFTDPVSPLNIRTMTDSSSGMVRVEVRCARCNAHLGHVFTDGPLPSGRRYCMNSAALAFEKKA